MPDITKSFPLAVFEEYMLLDDRASYPMEFFCLLRFLGTMDDERFVEAVDHTVSRHPLMSCVIEKATARDWCWVPSKKNADVRFLDASKPGTVNESGFPNTQRLDVFHSPGFRAYVVKHADGCEVVLQFHHAVSDGMGASQFIRELLLTYAIGSGQGSWKLLDPVPDVSILPLRNNLGWSISSYIRNIHYTWPNIARFMLGYVRTVLPWPDEPKEAPRSYPTIISRTLTQQETTDFFASTKSRIATVNDALIDSAVRTVARWQSTIGSLPRRGRFRVAVPMNMRDSRHSGMPVSNVVTMVFLDFHYRDISKNQSLLSDVHRQMDSIKKHEQRRLFGGILLSGKHLAMLIGQNLSIHLRDNRCRSTICLSNLGRPFDDWPLEQTANQRLITGDLILDSLVISPPIRAKTLLSYSGTTYAGKLNLSLRYDPFYLSRDDAQTLIDLMYNEIRS